eukprot:gnl/TRDRNA2_/TRDRNA2_56122_c0_seq1.p1 gnl/TRDRNA2_/TRDRNA2_56122_c0~~gnl/TRDRNA2_/TRDRNA2_56122_c0_seq1.p1  ORF type:complete len:471 (+),score=68.42 gnl/TRDRNA2_/TRDRNA2_56122_c0_seq1:112-1524(+)
MNHLKGLDISEEIRRAIEQACCTPEKMAQYSQLRKLLAAEKDLVVRPDEITTLRFLMAEKFDINKAHQRLVGTIKWRQEKQVDRLLTMPPPLVIQERYHRARQLCVLGHDKQHRLFTYDAMANFVAIGGDNIGTKDDFTWCAIWHFEYSYLAKRNLSKACRRPIWQELNIIDCKGMSLSLLPRIPHALSLLIHLDRHAGYHFPESLYKMMVINVPHTLFAVLQKGLQAFDPGTVSKIELFEDVPKDRFLELVDSDQLPPCLGGTAPSEVLLPQDITRADDLPPWNPPLRQKQTVGVSHEQVSGEFAAAIRCRAALEQDVKELVQRRMRRAVALPMTSARGPGDGTTTNGGGESRTTTFCIVLVAVLASTFVGRAAGILPTELVAPFVVVTVLIGFSLLAVQHEPGKSKIPPKHLADPPPSPKKPTIFHAKPPKQKDLESKEEFDYSLPEPEVETSFPACACCFQRRDASS